MRCGHMYFIFLSLFCKMQKNLPGFCGWFLIESVSNSIVFRSQTGKMWCGQICFRKHKNTHTYTEICGWILISKLEISEVCRSQTKKMRLRQISFPPLFFCKRKSWPKFCRWILIEILAISAVFRSQTKKWDFGRCLLFPFLF